MAAFNFTSSTQPMLFGRSGYNSKPDDDDEKKDQGRSGYNGKPQDDDDDKNQGRSGYNKGDKSDDDEDNKRSLRI